MKAHRHEPLLAVLTAAIFVCVPSAQAGMTVYGLRDIYELRLEEISFFVVLFVVSSFLFRFLWNHGLHGIGSLPRIGFLQSLCVSVVLGLGMLVILTMISGIREVLTPGAWKRQGSRYHLAHPSKEPERQRALLHLSTALFDYARAHNGRFPPHDFVPDIPERLWEAPDEKGTHYIYVGGLTTSDAGRLLAVEPPSFGSPRYVLNTAGELEKLAEEVIAVQWQSPVKP